MRSVTVRVDREGAATDAIFLFKNGDVNGCLGFVGKLP